MYFDDGQLRLCKNSMPTLYFIGRERDRYCCFHTSLADRFLIASDDRYAPILSFVVIGIVAASCKC